MTETSQGRYPFIVEGRKQCFFLLINGHPSAEFPSAESVRQEIRQRIQSKQAAEYSLLICEERHAHHYREKLNAQNN